MRGRGETAIGRVNQRANPNRLVTYAADGSACCRDARAASRPYTGRGDILYRYRQQQLLGLIVADCYGSDYGCTGSTRADGAVTGATVSPWGRPSGITPSHHLMLSRAERGGGGGGGATRCNRYTISSRRCTAAGRPPSRHLGRSGGRPASVRPTHISPAHPRPLSSGKVRPLPTFCPLFSSGRSLSFSHPLPPLSLSLSLSLPSSSSISVSPAPLARLSPSV